MEIEYQIKKELESRKSFSFYSSHLSFDECRTFFECSLRVQSWTCVLRDEYFFLAHDQLPPEMWGEILAFLTDDSSSLYESLLVPDLRCGFFSPFPICSFSSRDIPLLKMIPLIEGMFRHNRWTLERLYRFGLHSLYEIDNH